MEREDGFEPRPQTLAGCIYTELLPQKWRAGHADSNQAHDGVKFRCLTAWLLDHRILTNYM